jgi:hypothetical protein
MTITLFSSGYWGWGNATERLVEAVDAAEQARGFGPPMFVDTLAPAGACQGLCRQQLPRPRGRVALPLNGDLGNLAIATGSSGVQIKGIQ